MQKNVLTMNKRHLQAIQKSLPNQVQNFQIENTIKLFDGGATMPFIARYRKEMTGGLDEVQIATIKESYKKVLEVDKRRDSILSSMTELNLLTDELKKQIENSTSLTELEDIYLPFKPKRKTRAVIARENGLEPLAKILMSQQENQIAKRAQSFINEKVKNIDDVLAGARDIIAEWANESIRVRNTVRNLFSREAVIESKVVKGKEEEGIKYKDYFAYSEPLKRCPSHRLLAMKRGEDEGFLRLSIYPPEEKALDEMNKTFLKAKNESATQVQLAIKDAYKRLLHPSIETEFMNDAKERSDLEAIKVFAENLRQLLLAPPLGHKRVLAIDPGFNSGCKIVCIDEQGNLLHNETIFPHPPQQQTSLASRKLSSLVNQYKIDAIAIGNGTAGRETEAFVKNKVMFDRAINVFIVNENGASIYSASSIAREEFPQYDVTVRGAVSIGRRLIDPLAELVKIDAKSIGVGQYQHDVDQNKLKESLDQVVESCVNLVGVNLNTASKHLLTYVSGLGPQLAQNIVEFRKENGAFKSRKQLTKVARLGDKSFEQSAGFLRIPEAENPLDNTAVHPESYPVVEKIAKDLKCSVSDIISKPELREKIDLQKYVTDKTGLPTLTDIMTELAKPGRDPRSKIRVFEFSKDVRKMEDLQIGMVLPGLVTNITNFGAFVDIGVKQDGLVHISNIKEEFTKNPADVLSLNQPVLVKVTEVDIARKRIQLSMKDVEQKKYAF